MKFLFLFFIAFTMQAQDTLDCVSYNIKWLGHYKAKENYLIAEFLKDKDLVIVQELVDAPIDGVYPDKSFYHKDLEAFEFILAMQRKGFSYWLSSSDSGKESNHEVGPKDEWLIVFYKSDLLQPDSTRYYGFVE